MPNGGTGNQRRQFVHTRVENILDDWIGWPQKFLKMHFETAGIFQNEVGEVLDEMVESGESDRIPAIIDDDSRPFIVRPDVTDVTGTEIFKLGADMYDFLSDSGILLI